jgi:bacterioferritin (cytochrome b1)
MFDVGRTPIPTASPGWVLRAPSKFRELGGLENAARKYYDRAATETRDAGDLGTFDLLRSILKDEEEHIDFVETQFDLMEMMGDQLYISRQVSSTAE